MSSNMLILGTFSIVIAIAIPYYFPLISTFLPFIPFGLLVIGILILILNIFGVGEE